MPSPRTWLRIFGSALVWVSGCSGGGAEEGCPTVGTCGGNPVGDWKVQNACQSVPALAYTTSILYPPQTMPQTPKLAGPQPSNRSSGDWCSELVYLPADDKIPDFPRGKVTNVNLYYAPAPLNFGTVLLTPDHSYQVGIAVGSHNTTHFAPACLIAHGASPTCSDVAEQIIAFYGPMPNYQDVVCCAVGSTPGSCLPDASNGCDCAYSYRHVIADQGAWQMSGNTLSFFSSTNVTQPIVETTFCAGGGQLSLSGRDGQSLFAILGLRTVSLVPNDSRDAM